MSPELQAYLDQQFAAQQAHIDAKFVTNFTNQWWMLTVLFGILLSKILIWRQMIGILREQGGQRAEQHKINTQLEVSTSTLSRQVAEVPAAVAVIAAEVAAKVADSATDGDLRKPPGL